MGFYTIYVQINNREFFFESSKSNSTVDFAYDLGSRCYKNPFYSSQSYYNTSAAEQMAKTFPYILTSGVLKERVEEELGLSYVPSVHASAIGNTNILTLTVTSNDPDLAYDVLLCIMDVYPEVAEFVVGPTSLALINDTGRPMHPSNSLSYTSSVVRGCTAAIVIYLIMSLFYYIANL